MRMEKTMNSVSVLIIAGGIILLIWAINQIRKGKELAKKAEEIEKLWF
jgi:small neutral amino acid transporter SnatA (MarC family)